jgi:hypothetical protein
MLFIIKLDYLDLVKPVHTVIQKVLFSQIKPYEPTYLSIK